MDILTNLPTLEEQRQWHLDARWGVPNPYMQWAHEGEGAFRNIAVIPTLLSYWIDGLTPLEDWVNPICGSKRTEIVGTDEQRRQRARKLIIDAARELYVMRGLSDRLDWVAYSEKADLSGVDYTVGANEITLEVQFRVRGGGAPNWLDDLKQRRSNQTSRPHDILMDSFTLDQTVQPWVPTSFQLDGIATHLKEIGNLIKSVDAGKQASWDMTSPAFQYGENYRLSEA